MYAGVVVLDAGTLETIETATAVISADFPYIPGFLSFREAPAVIAAIERLSVPPDLLMVDGHGLAHPRRCGLASHLGVLLDIPTVGVAKNILIGRSDTPGESRGDATPLVHKGEVVGSTLRTRDGVSPVHISIGHRLSLKTAVKWVLSAGGGYRLPEPTRRAHLAVNALRAGQNWRK
jgi:deoxyribonuclease V